MADNAANGRLCHNCDDVLSQLKPPVLVSCGHLMCQSCVSEAQMCLTCVAADGAAAATATDTRILTALDEERQRHPGVGPTDRTPAPQCEECDPGFKQDAVFACPGACAPTPCTRRLCAAVRLGGAPAAVGSLWARGAAANTPAHRPARVSVSPAHSAAVRRRASRVILCVVLRPAPRGPLSGLGVPHPPASQR